MRKRGLFLGMFLFAATRSAWPQAASFGVKGGVPIDTTNGTRDESRPYIVGPSVEFRLPANFAIEVDALYRRVGNSFGFISIGSGSNLNPTTVSSFNRDRGNSWEFPFLGKYYFRSRSESWQPFAGTGWALRGTWFHSDSSVTQPDQNGVVQTTKYHSSYTDSLGVGAVVAAGVRLHKGRFAFAPEVRYTRWGSANFERNSRNEGGILLGISF